jgi:protein-tyrosine-phosphatase
MRPYIGRNIVRIMREKGISIQDDGARKIDDFMLKWADRIIIVGDNVVPEMLREFKGKVIAIWLIRDISENDLPGIERRIDEIEGKVKALVAKLK